MLEWRFATGGHLDYRSSIAAIRAIEDGQDAFFAAVARIEDFDPDAFAGFVRHHKLLPWLARVEPDSRAVDFLPAALLTELRETRAGQAQRSATLLRESAEVRDALRDRGVEPLFLKGQCLAQRFYGCLNLRHQWDVDVLVRHRDFEAAVEVLERLGYGGFDRRRSQMIAQRASDAWHGISLYRDTSEIDLHWTLRNRVMERVDEEHLWTNRQVVCIDGIELETLSLEDTLAHLSSSIGLDLRRGALRAKALLDLHLGLRAYAAGADWDSFLERRDREGLLALTVNVLSVFLPIWCRPGELPELTRALERHASLVVVSDAEAATRLVSRPRHAPENQAWFERAYRSGRRRRVWWRWRSMRDARKAAYCRDA